MPKKSKNNNLDKYREKRNIDKVDVVVQMTKDVMGHSRSLPTIAYYNISANTKNAPYFIKEKENAKEIKK